MYPGVKGPIGGFRHTQNILSILVRRPGYVTDVWLPPTYDTTRRRVYGDFRGKQFLCPSLPANPPYDGFVTARITTRTLRQ